MVVEITERTPHHNILACTTLHCRTNTTQTTNWLQVILFFFVFTRCSDVSERHAASIYRVIVFSSVECSRGWQKKPHQISQPEARRDFCYQSYGKGMRGRMLRQNIGIKFESQTETTLQHVNTEICWKFWLYCERRHSSVQLCLHPYWKLTLWTSLISLVPLHSCHSWHPLQETRSLGKFHLEQPKSRVDKFMVYWPLNRSHVWLFQFHSLYAFCSHRKLNFQLTWITLRPPAKDRRPSFAARQTRARKRRLSEMSLCSRELYDGRQYTHTIFYALVACLKSGR
jgi:hypothetical protein